MVSFPCPFPLVVLPHSFCFSKYLHFNLLMVTPTSLVAFHFFYNNDHLSNLGWLGILYTCSSSFILSSSRTSFISISDVLKAPVYILILFLCMMLNFFWDSGAVQSSVLVYLEPADYNIQFSSEIYNFIYAASDCLYNW